MRVRVILGELVVIDMLAPVPTWAVRVKWPFGIYEGAISSNGFQVIFPGGSSWIRAVPPCLYGVWRVWRIWYVARYGGPLNCGAAATSSPQRPGGRALRSLAQGPGREFLFPFPPAGGYESEIGFGDADE